jgi:hypothetical protein
MRVVFNLCSLCLIKTFVLILISFSSKASSVTAAHLEEEDLLLPELSLIDQVDGACESKPFQTKSDASCFGKKPKPNEHHGRGGSSSGSFSEGSDADGPIRMISARPTSSEAEAALSSSPTDTTVPKNEIPLILEPAVPQSVAPTEESPTTSLSYESTRAVRRPTDPSTLAGSFDSAKAVRQPTELSIEDDSSEGPAEEGVSRFQTAMD